MQPGFEPRTFSYLVVQLYQELIQTRQFHFSIRDGGTELQDGYKQQQPRFTALAEALLGVHFSLGLTDGEVDN